MSKSYPLNDVEARKDKKFRKDLDKMIEGKWISHCQMWQSEYDLWWRGCLKRCYWKLQQQMFLQVSAAGQSHKHEIFLGAGWLYISVLCLCLASDGFKHFCFVHSQATYFEQQLLEKWGLASLKIDIKSTWDQTISNLCISTWSEVGRQHSREKIWEGFKCALNTKAMKPDSCSVIHSRVRE